MKKKMGRPLKVGTPRDVELRLRVTKLEKDIIFEAARIKGFSGTSAFVRKAMLTKAKAIIKAEVTA
jgi:uncharacterized protein (DUF1778 family)